MSLTSMSMFSRSSNNVSLPLPQQLAARIENDNDVVKAVAAQIISNVVAKLKDDALLHKSWTGIQENEAILSKISEKYLQLSSTIKFYSSNLFLENLSSNLPLHRRFWKSLPHNSNLAGQFLEEITFILKEMIYDEIKKDPARYLSLYLFENKPTASWLQSLELTPEIQAAALANQLGIAIKLSQTNTNLYDIAASYTYNPTAGNLIAVKVHGSHAEIKNVMPATKGLKPIALDGSPLIEISLQPLREKIEINNKALKNAWKNQTHTLSAEGLKQEDLIAMRCKDLDSEDFYYVGTEFGYDRLIKLMKSSDVPTRTAPEIESALIAGIAIRKAQTEVIASLKTQADSSVEQVKCNPSVDLEQHSSSVLAY